MELKIGGIYRLDRTRFYSGYGNINQLIFTLRVMAYDKYEVFVDVIHRGEHNWSMNQKYNRLVWFGKFSMKSFEEDAVEIGFAEFTEELKEFYSQDLPIRISRLKNCSWTDSLFESRITLNEYIQKNTSEQWRNLTLDLSKAILVSSKGSSTFGKQEVITADNGNYFTATELLWKASQIQRQVIKKESPGVGLFRGGTKKGLPFYYMGDYLGYSRYLKDLEESGVDTDI